MFPIRSARAAIAVGIGLTCAAACRGAPPRPRERVLAQLPGDAIAIVAADGRALSHPRIRAVLDAAAASWPASFACVVDAATASDAIALGVDRAGSVAVIAALPRAPRCPALSQREPGLWIATLGAGPSTAAGSALDDPRWARARPYLTTAPIAAAVLGDVHALAAAQPDPLDAWLAIDAGSGGDAIARDAAARLARLAQDPATSAIAARIAIERPSPTQVVVRIVVRIAGQPGNQPGNKADSQVDSQLAAAARAILAWSDGDPAPPAAAPPSIACPAPAGGVTCSGGTQFRVGSIATDLAPIVSVGRPAPVVVDGIVTGLRLAESVRWLGLRGGDVVVAMDGRLASSRRMLAGWIAEARLATSVTVRRDGGEIVLLFSER